jgi:hypothetical protein
MNCIVGDGSTISIGGATIGEVQSIDFGGGGFEMYDASAMETEGLRPFLQSLAEDGGEITIAYRNKTSQKPDRGILSVTLTLSDNTTITMSALLQSHSSSVPAKGIYSHSMRLKISGT